VRVSYSEEEVGALIRDYAAFREKAGTTRAGLRVLVRLIDLARAMELLPIKYRGVVLLYGLLGLSLDETAALLHVSHQAVSKRYRQGVEEITFSMNGGYDH